jgi:hypothetical protein
MPRVKGFVIRGAVVGALLGLANGLYFVIASLGTDVIYGWTWVPYLSVVFGCAGALLGLILAALVRWLKEP